MHSAIPELRKLLLPPEWVRRVQTDDSMRTARYILMETGLIGVSLIKQDQDRVKCLHAHVGDTLVRGRDSNPIGELVMARLQQLGVPLDGTDDCWKLCTGEPKRRGRAERLADQQRRPAAASAVS